MCKSKKLPFVIVSFFCAISMIVCYYTQDRKIAINDLRTEKSQKADRPQDFLRYFQFIKTADLPQNKYSPNYRFKAWKIAQQTAQTARYETTELTALERGPANVGGRTRAIIIDYEDDAQKTWFAGSVGGGVWRTQNMGRSWVNLTENMPNLAISCLAQSPSNPKILYAGTGEGFGNFGSPIGNGIFRSEDKGQNWTFLESTIQNPDFEYVNDILIHPDDQNILVCATNTGIYKTENGGKTWVQTYTTQNAVQDLVFHPSDFNHLYASVNSEGVIKSTNAGTTWDNPTTNPIYGLHTPVRTALAISPKNPNKIYASVEISSSSSGLFVSEDAGISWLKLDISSNHAHFLDDLGWYANVLAVSPIDDNIVYAGGVNLFKFTIKSKEYFDLKKEILSVQQNETNQFMDFYKTTGFNRWGQKLKVNRSLVSIEIRFGKGKSQKAHRFVVPTGSTSHVSDETYEYMDLVDVPFEVWDVTNNRQLAFSFRDQARDGVFNLIPQNITSTSASEHSREYMYIHNVEYQDTKNDDIAKKGGHKFKNMYMLWPFLAENAIWNANKLPEATFQIIYDFPKLRQATASNVSDAYGEYTRKNKSLHPDHHVLKLIPKAKNVLHILNGNDGGIAYSEDGGKSFQSRSHQYNTTQFYGVDKNPLSNHYIGGTQDNGSLKSHQTTHYRRVKEGDGFEAVWHATDSNKMLITSYHNQIFRTENAGKNWTTANGSILDKKDPKKAGFITRLGYSSLAPDIVFTVGVRGVWRSKNFGISWRNTKITSNWAYKNNSDAKGSILSLLVRPSEASANYVWAGAGMSNHTNLHVSVDGGLHFQAVQNYPNLQAPLSGLYPHPTDSMSVFALFSVAGKAKILHSTDLGKNWSDITRFEAGKSTNGFPDVATYSMLIFPDNYDRIWAGTEIGIFESLDAGKSWHYLSHLIPATAIWDMKIRDHQIVIATHGRGIWTVDLPPSTVINTESMLFDEQKLNIYPNPSHGQFSVRLPLSWKESVFTVTMTDNLGRKIYTQKYNNKSVLHLSMSHVSLGVYHLIIQGNTQMIRSRIIIR